MNIRKAVLALALVALAAAANAASMKVLSFTGTLTIKNKAGKTVTVKAGEKAPAIKAGDTVTVDEGSAVLSSNGETITAGAGTQTVWDGKNLDVVKGSVTVTKGAETKTVLAGQTLEVVVPAKSIASNPSAAAGIVIVGSPVQNVQTSQPVSPSAP